ncbi:hypothetical protein BO99DRAFT_399890 [Aspergillus violaceofuscus CBS 115571]|uniref:Uncharacterized protein n=1 Tax=Aspergillus violaceofuscus (strain CBS 115571) TaxID=1450538 RepID=A0A2V5HDI3_ASPV1|nr:hypothetical protein BO99DRAFT_399890 [Aspergillus violaceofuscus CBS 115571]
MVSPPHILSIYCLTSSYSPHRSFIVYWTGAYDSQQSPSKVVLAALRNQIPAHSIAGMPLACLGLIIDALIVGYYCTSQNRSGSPALEWRHVCMYE